MKLKKPHGISITIRDRKMGKSKTFSRYETTLENVYRKVKRALK